MSFSYSNQIGRIALIYNPIPGTAAVKLTVQYASNNTVVSSLSVEELRDLRHLIDRALSTADKNEMEYQRQREHAHG